MKFSRVSGVNPHVVIAWVGFAPQITNQDEHKSMGCTMGCTMGYRTGHPAAYRGLFLKYYDFHEIFVFEVFFESSLSSMFRPKHYRQNNHTDRGIVSHVL